jgi:rhodanese-related sulfurtransferase
VCSSDLAESLAECASCDVYVLDGGMDAWKRSGLPTVIDASQPMELSRQVHIAAGLLVLLGVILGTVVSPWFYILSGFVGAGLVFAGLSGFCGMARLLMKAPWNRRAGLS